MKSDLEKSKDELIEELNVLRQQAAGAEALQNHLADVEKSYKELQASFAERARALERECLDRDQTEEALRMAEVIIDNSPAILFRRSAGSDPRLAYVSDNVRQLGYTAEEFMSGKITFREIVHPDDEERVGQEIRYHTEKDVDQIKSHVEKPLPRCDEQLRIDGRIRAPQTFPETLEVSAQLPERSGPSTRRAFADTASEATASRPCRPVLSRFPCERERPWGA